MKLCAVYKSSRKIDTYLYVSEKGDFSKLPSALLKAFGAPIFVMLIPVIKRAKIAQLPRHVLIEKIEKEGYYLQLPPKIENLLDGHRFQNEISAKS